MGKIQHLQVRFHPVVSVRRPGVLAVSLRGGRRLVRTYRPHLPQGTGQTAAAPSRRRGKHVPRGGGFGAHGDGAGAGATSQSDRAEV
jgi:hypothetical protein